jgi:2-oxo-3-hexenedioate decarboxylase
MSAADPAALAREVSAAYASRQSIAVPPSARDAGFDLAAAYAVEAEIVRMKQASGHKTVGRKVGFASKAVWRALKLETLAWAHMYDDTVHAAVQNEASLPMDRMLSPKIEPEIVFGMRGPLETGQTDPATILEAVEWLALGFEIIDCVYADWKFQPADFVASSGFHAALIVGDRVPVVAAGVQDLAAQLAAFKVRLMKDGQVAAEGSGKNVLRSPALCLRELAAALARQPGASPLDAGELISSGTLTESQPIASGETWTAVLEGLDLPALTVRTRG